MNFIFLNYSTSLVRYSCYDLIFSSLAYHLSFTWHIINIESHIHLAFELESIKQLIISEYMPDILPHYKYNQIAT